MNDAHQGTRGVQLRRAMMGRRRVNATVQRCARAVRHQGFPRVPACRPCPSCIISPIVAPFTGRNNPMAECQRQGQEHRRFGTVRERFSHVSCRQHLRADHHMCHDEDDEIGRCVVRPRGMPMRCVALRRSAPRACVNHPVNSASACPQAGASSHARPRATATATPGRAQPSPANDTCRFAPVDQRTGTLLTTGIGAWAPDLSFWAESRWATSMAHNWPSAGGGASMRMRRLHARTGAGQETARC